MVIKTMTMTTTKTITVSMRTLLTTTTMMTKICRLTFWAYNGVALYLWSVDSALINTQRVIESLLESF